MGYGPSTFMEELESDFGGVADYSPKATGLGLDVPTKKTRCSNCRFHEIGLKGDHALRCSGKVGSKMRHDALKVLLARAFKQAGFVV